MENQEKKLGRGLSALIGESKINKISTSNIKVDNIELIKLEKIKAGKYQPRQDFNEQKIIELSESIKESGLLQPIILRKAGDDNEYEIIAGERRFRASKLAGLTEIPAIIKKLNNHQALEFAIIENVQRADLTIVEEAKSYKKLMQEFSYTQEQVAKKVSKSRSHVANILRILNLPQNIQDMLNNSLITMGHARAVINANNQEDLINEIINKKLTVRDVENIIKEDKILNLNNLAKTNTNIRFVNKDHLAFFEENITKFSQMNTKITYNALKNNGKIILHFDDFDKLHSFTEKLEDKSN
jgi:ParB family transcriptional regulator, chromosome partitioning protein